MLYANFESTHLGADLHTKIICHMRTQLLEEANHLDLVQITIRHKNGFIAKMSLGCLQKKTHGH
jgi:hypothetical protein